jgi:hypothetical protein
LPKFHVHHDVVPQQNKTKQNKTNGNNIFEYLLSFCLFVCLFVCVCVCVCVCVIKWVSECEEVFRVEMTNFSHLTSIHSSVVRKRRIVRNASFPWNRICERKRKKLERMREWVRISLSPDLLYFDTIFNLFNQNILEWFVYWFQRSSFRHLQPHKYSEFPNIPLS